MILAGMHSAIRDQSQQVQGSSLLACMFERGNNDRMAEKLAGANQFVDASDVHVDYTARTDVEMADLAVAHLPVGQANEMIGSVQQAVGILRQQLVVDWLARQRDGMGVRLWPIAPAIEDPKYNRFFEWHVYSPAFTAAKPRNSAPCPSSSSMRSNWLYLAMRSVREAEPVLICPTPVATARSAMKVSSVSPLRCDMIDV